jgi:DNA-binding MarR family transcriptional regulator
MEFPHPDASPSKRQRDLEDIELGRLHGLLAYALRRACVRSAATFAVTIGPRVREAELDVLFLIEANAGIKQTTLAAAIGVDRSTMVRLIDRAEGNAFVQRKPSKTDRRVVPPRLTAAGARFLERVWPRVAIHEAKLTEALTAQERRTLLLLLHKIAFTPRRRPRGATATRRARGAES